jgi:Cysteine-rich CWC
MVEAESRCPLCAGGFHCGANDAEPCACNLVQLDDATLADLRARYTGCLCLICLREIAASTQRPEVDR